MLTLISKPSPSPNTNKITSLSRTAQLDQETNSYRKGDPQETHTLQFYFEHLHYYTAIAIQYMGRSKLPKQISPKEIKDANS